MLSQADCYKFKFDIWLWSKWPGGLWVIFGKLMDEPMSSLSVMLATLGLHLNPVFRDVYLQL